MSSLHHRSASATERRSAAASAGPSRISSARVKDYERPFVRDEASPAFSDNNSNAENDLHKYRKVDSEVSNIERRRERVNVVTREKTVTRKSPIKESISAANRGEPDRQRRSLESPILRRKPKEADLTTPWGPVASLVSRSSAPLAVRISVPPLSSTAPANIQPSTFAGMMIEEQEAAILDDLLYVFMGYEGAYIRFADQYQPTDEKDRLAGPPFQIVPGLDPSLRDLTSSMLHLATHYSAMEAFVEVQSREEFGSVHQSLCAAIRNLLKDYLILMAQLEMKVINDPKFTLHQMHLAIMPTAQTLAQLYALAQEVLKKNSLLEDDLDDSIDDLDADNIIERLREGGDLLPGSLAKKRCIGGNVLALLTQRLATYSGDPAARSLLELLLREASRPYVTMLSEWLHHGAIRDPHAEFLVGERASIKRERMDEDYTDEYWEKRYYVREKEVPPQLDGLKEKVLLAGKYLNVVRECGGVNITSQIKDTPKSFDDPRFLDNINNAYASANTELLNLLLTKNSLRSRLRSMKHYFFLDRAEFFLYFLELSGSELKKPHKNVNTSKLQSLLDLVVHQPGSIAMADPFKEDIKIKINEIGLTQWLMKIVTVQGIDQDNPDSIVENYKTPAPSSSISDDKDINGFEALELDYTVPFPLSLIISRKTVLRYQLIFRYTLALRHLETVLVDCWQEHTKVQSWHHKSSDRRIEIWKRRAWTLRARMLVFTQQMLFFATAEVIEPNWQKLMAKVDDNTPTSQPDPHHALPPTTPASRAKRTVDELMQDHLDMLDSTMKDLGLTQSKLLKIHAKMISGCTLFATYTTNISRSLYTADADLVGTAPAHAPGGEHDPHRVTRMQDTLKKYEDHFNHHLRILIDSLNYYAATETVGLLGLCARLTNAEVQKRDDGAVGMAG